MAQKYLDVSLTTGLNDGSSIANAWQDANQVATNTMAAGSYAAGDIINVRTHDGTSALGQTGIATITFAAVGTEAAPVTFKFDDGVIWANSGEFLWEVTGQTTSFSFASWTQFSGVKLSDTQYGVRFSHNNPTTNATIAMIFKSSHHVGAAFEITPSVSTRANEFNINIKTTLFCEQCYFASHSNYSSSSHGTWSVAESCRFTLLDCVTDLQDCTFHLMDGIKWSSSIEFIGGKIINIGTNIGLFNDSLSTSNSSTAGLMVLNNCNCSGLDIEKSINNGLGNKFHAVENGCFSLFSSFVVNSLGYRRWARGLNYPTHSALLPDGTPWVMKVLPRQVSKQNPFANNEVVKYYNGATASITATLELVIKNTVGLSGAYDNPKNDEWFMKVTYVDDATGNYVTEETLQDGSALTPSTATWVPEVNGQVSYGAINYDKYKLELITSKQVRANTKVSAILYSGKPSVASDDFYFVDQEIGIV